jgi:hypothetical protein
VFNIKPILTCLFCGFLTFVVSQNHKKVLFIGNSYTGANDLPQLVYNICISTGDSLSVSAFSPGGQRLEEHVAPGSPARLEIESGQYDFVVLQEQSQIPSLPENQVQTLFYPNVKKLDSIIHLANACSKTILYMTWGRKNGDDMNCDNWPPVCTYKGMDSLLNLRYTKAALDNHCLISPVGAAWNYVIRNHPNIELYDGDGSHPNQNGSYLAACCFYSILHQKSPLKISFQFIDSATSQILKNAANEVVYNDLNSWGIQQYNPKALFNYNLLPDTAIQFQNVSQFADTFFWDFGNGQTSNEKEPFFNCAFGNTYNVKLKAVHCNEIDTLSKIIETHSTSFSMLENSIPISIFPNPCLEFINLNQIVEGTCNIVSLQGKIIKKYTRIGERINISDLEAGVYTLCIHLFNGETQRLKFIKIE